MNTQESERKTKKHKHKFDFLFVRLAATFCVCLHWFSCNGTKIEGKRDSWASSARNHWKTYPLVVGRLWSSSSHSALLNARKQPNMKRSATNTWVAEGDENLGHFNPIPTLCYSVSRPLNWDHRVQAVRANAPKFVASGNVNYILALIFARSFCTGSRLYTRLKAELCVCVRARG